MTLFNQDPFESHSGLQLPWKFDCSALTRADFQSIATIVARRIQFSHVEGIPRGGTLLAHYLYEYVDPAANKLLIVDDVLTTGKSMERQRAGRDAVGFVILHRGERKPEWVVPLFVLHGHWCHTHTDLKKSVE